MALVEQLGKYADWESCGLRDFGRSEIFDQCPHAIGEVQYLQEMNVLYQFKF